MSEIVETGVLNLPPEMWQELADLMESFADAEPEGRVTVCEKLEEWLADVENAKRWHKYFSVLAEGAAVKVCWFND